jgi:hypothetical protein
LRANQEEGPGVRVERSGEAKECRVMAITKSKRHSRIIGQFGEWLVCNWLSRSGFEVMYVDHISIDIVAFREDIGRLGISVKSRTKLPRRENVCVTMFVREEGKDEIANIQDVCKDFALQPWIAVYVETESFGDLYLTSLDHYLDEYCGKSTRRFTWMMIPEYKARYEQDRKVMHVRCEFTECHWPSTISDIESYDI